MQQKTNIKMKTKTMKTKKRVVRSQMKFIVRQFAVLISVSVGGWLNAAGPSDLKTFTPEETYVVEGASIVLTQKMGEASVKVGSAVNDPTALTAANGAKFDRERELQDDLGIYRLQSTGTVSEATAKAALDSLNQDANVQMLWRHKSLNSSTQPAASGFSSTMKSSYVSIKCQPRYRAPLTLHWI
jgi:hypothetical protein